MPGKKSKNKNALTLVLFAIYLLILSWLVLLKLQFSFPAVEESRAINLIPFAESFGDNGVFRFGEIRNNIVVFIPLGIYICLLKRSWPFAKKVFAIFALTLGFEATQFIFAIGRADATDVLSNTIGGIIGIGIYALLLKLLKGKANKVIIALAAIATFSVLLVIALLLASNRWIRIQ